MIRVQRKVTVGKAVHDVYREACEKKLREYHSRLSCMSRVAQGAFLKSNRYKIGALYSILKDNGPGEGMDLAITRLRSVDLAEINVVWIEDAQYLVGKTWQPLEIELVSGRRGPRRNWEESIEKKVKSPGGYEIWVPARSLGGTNINSIAFLPADDIRLAYRHMHHYVRPDPYHRDSIHIGVEYDHPVKAEPVFCWSQFGSPVSDAMASVDIPGLFQLLRKFAGRFYPGSPLVGLNELKRNGVIA